MSADVFMQVCAARAAGSHDVYILRDSLFLSYAAFFPLTRPSPGGLDVDLCLKYVWIPNAATGGVRKG